MYDIDGVVNFLLSKCIRYFIPHFQTFHFNIGKYGIRGCILRQITGFFFKIFSCALIHRILPQNYEIFLITNGEHDIRRCVLLQSKGQGMDTKIFLGASAATSYLHYDFKN